MTLRSLPAVGVLLVAVALTAGCGGDEADPSSAAPTSSPTASAPPAVAPSSAVPSNAPTPSVTPSRTGGAPPASIPPSTAPQGPTQHRPASPPPVVLPQRPVGAPGAQQIVEAFKAAGLKVAHPKDRSVDCGPDGLGLGCSELIATDAVTVYVFPDETSAGDIAETWAGQSYRRGAVVLNYLEAKTPAANRPRYEQVLNGLR
ncbi:hypothetical protein AB0B85_19215 [Micromonospora sp. NPDC049044]|uniref:hypothetical protein n=1 Tax=Micromonospora sp. NPDC049044 TaxID=3154827 RepID=UPI0033E667A5